MDRINCVTIIRAMEIAGVPDSGMSTAWKAIWKSKPAVRCNFVVLDTINCEQVAKWNITGCRPSFQVQVSCTILQRILPNRYINVSNRRQRARWNPSHCSIVLKNIKIAGVRVLETFYRCLLPQKAKWNSVTKELWFLFLPRLWTLTTELSRRQLSRINEWTLVYMSLNCVFVFWKLSNI